MVEITKPGLLDLEKELTCSVSIAGNNFTARLWDTAYTLQTVNANDPQNLDLYRNPLSTTHSPRLPSYILWFLSQGMVLIASLPSGTLQIQSI